VGRSAIVVKQKSQAAAAFLGILPISRNVLGTCCILTTILPAFLRGLPISETKSGNTSDRLKDAFGESTPPVKTRVGSP
jgi:hypothetical protein